MASITNDVFSTIDPVGLKYGTLGKMVGTVLGYIYVLGGLALLVSLLLGGITLMTAGSDQAKVKEGYGRISRALIGFLIIFVSYFLAQLVEVVLGVKIL